MSFDCLESNMRKECGEEQEVGQGIDGLGIEGRNGDKDGRVDWVMEDIGWKNRRW